MRSSGNTPSRNAPVRFSPSTNNSPELGAALLPLVVGSSLSTVAIQVNGMNGSDRFDQPYVMSSIRSRTAGSPSTM
jgi:hypothetical protein